VNVKLSTSDLICEEQIVNLSARASAMSDLKGHS
jgi:hypothetical protein